MDTWRHEFVIASQERESGRMSELLGGVRRGMLVPVSRGIYRRASARSTDPAKRGDDDYVASIRAAQLRSRSPLVFRGMSAAALWGLPVVGTWPDSVLVAAPPEAGGRSNAHLRRSYVGHPPPTTMRDGLVVTTLARTVIDVAREETMERAVAVADAALHTERVDLPTLFDELARVGTVPGSARAMGVLQFAQEGAASAGESCSRVGMWRLGLPAPLLQHEFRDSAGLIGIVDFWWPHLRIVGEFDGLGKYLRDEFTGGRSIEQIVYAEKVREDRLRAIGLRVVRWGWPEAINLAALETKLRLLR